MDLPPDIPASNFDLINLSHAVDTFKPSFYDLGDLPTQIPIFNKDNTKVKRFIKRRIVSAPPMAHEFNKFSRAQNRVNYKELPEVPAANNDTQFAEAPVQKVRDFSVPIILNQSGFQPTFNYNKNPHQQMSSQKPLITQKSMTYTTIRPVSEKPGNKNNNHISYNQPATLDPKPQQRNSKHESKSSKDSLFSSSSSNYSFVDSLFSDDSLATSLKESTPPYPVEKEDHSHYLPKIRTKRQQQQQDSSKSNIPLNYCLDTPRIYSESRFPRIVTNPIVKNTTTLPANPYVQSRSVSDSINVKQLPHPPLQSNNNQRPNSVQMKRHISAFIGRWKTKEIQEHLFASKNLPEVPNYYNERENRFGDRQLYT
ncbi:hypothetical protein KGF54_002685 [Candida jiufengensis]|uniref:uncharacterized protein n=1 Tax=Candida jiufengensis TaxID=497108 RepID=UPI002224742C|nr:uncharacterized protein KGF54_002685 [Candida jiufengensis]KAI5953314.1 hypothetical protein KGF54_002685 [Candida jiufengensis]